MNRRHAAALLAMGLLAGCAAQASPQGVPTVASSWQATVPPATASTPPLPVTPAPAPVQVASPAPRAICTMASRLALWTTQRLAWQVIAVPVQMGDVRGATAEVASGAGAVLLFGATAPSDLRHELTGLESSAAGGVAPLVMADLEGGAVERAANLLGPMPSARTLAQTMAPAAIEAYAAAVGRRMRTLGITMDLAPVMDLDGGAGPTTSNPDGTRSFSADPRMTARDAGAFAAGLEAAGVIAVGKHFPGLHGAGDNTDLGPAATNPWSALQARELVPYRVAIAAGMRAIMLSNASVPGLSSLPASISPQVIAALRGQVGFRGLLLTDSLSAAALSAHGLDVPAAATAAIIAGADMVLYNSPTADVAAVAGATAAAIAATVASGRLPRSQLVAAVGRVLAAKGVTLCPSE